MAKSQLMVMGPAQGKERTEGESSANAPSVEKLLAKIVVDIPRPSRKTPGHETMRGRLCRETCLPVNIGRTALGPHRKVVQTRGTPPPLPAL